MLTNLSWRAGPGSHRLDRGQNAGTWDLARGNRFTQRNVHTSPQTQGRCDTATECLPGVGRCIERRVFCRLFYPAAVRLVRLSIEVPPDMHMRIDEPRHQGEVAQVVTDIACHTAACLDRDNDTVADYDVAVSPFCSTTVQDGGCAHDDRLLCSDTCRRHGKQQGETDSDTRTETHWLQSKEGWAQSHSLRRRPGSSPVVDQNKKRPVRRTERASRAPNAMLSHPYQPHSE